MTTGDARSVVLSRVRAALAGGTAVPVDVPRAYRTTGDLPAGAPELLDLLVGRLQDYRATVRRCPASELAGTLRATLVARGSRRVLVPSGLPTAWTDGWAVAGLTAVVDGPGAVLDVAALDGVDAVLTACTVAVAETGTFVLDGSPDQGRRALTLVPDHHVVVVRAHQVVHRVPDALPLLDPTRALTWVSGPSATSDIELERVEGVHGPRVLDVVLTED